MKSETYPLIVIAVLMAMALVLAAGYPYLQAKMLPLLVSGVVFILAVTQLVRELSRRKKSPELEGKAKTGAKVRHRPYFVEMAWTVGYALGVYLVGWMISIPAFTVAYMKAHQTKWSTAVLVATSMTLFTYLIFFYLLGLDSYPGLILWQFGIQHLP